MMEIKDGKMYVNILGIDILMEERDNKVYLHVLDINNAKDQIVSWEVMVYKDDFYECVQRKQELESVITVFALTGVCKGGEW